MIKLSVTSKLGTKSWSLQAITTCPGSSDGSGNLVPACSGCYATSGYYRMKNVIAPREHNQIDWKRDEWTSEMIVALKKETHFRLFDSGDLYDLKLAQKWYEVMQQSPNTKFWLPTRMYKFTKFQGILDGMEALPNVKVRFSSDNVDGSYIPGVHGSCIIPTADIITDAFVCNAPSTNGTCAKCRACYDKEIPTIAYIAHGIKMKRIISINKI